MKSFIAEKVTKHEYILAQHEVSKAYVSVTVSLCICSQSGMLCKQMHPSARNFKNYLSFYKRICEYQHSFFSKHFRTTGMQIKALLSVKRIKTLQAWPSIGVRFQPEIWMCNQGHRVYNPACCHYDSVLEG